MNHILSTVFRILFFPLNYLSDFWGLFLVSILTGILMLFFFKKVSNQDAILTTKNRIKAHLLAIRLYKHDAVLSLAAMGRLFFENARYLSLAFIPMLVMIVPVSILIIQLSARYGYQPAKVEQPILVRVHAQDSVDLQKINISASSGLRVDLPPLYVPSAGEIYWRIFPSEQGQHELIFSYHEKNEPKKIVVGDHRAFISAKRVHSFLLAFFYPGEERIKSSFLQEIKIDYPDKKIHIAGWEIHWLVFFLVISIAAGFLAKGALGVHL